MFFEVDQTGMEIHQRCSKDGEGLMAHFMGLLQHIAQFVTTKIGNNTKLHGKKISYDVASGMRLKMFIGRFSYSIVFNDMMLDSGWMLTSLMNFVNELFGTLAAHVDNPEHLMSCNRQGRFHVELGTHDFTFTSVALPDSPVESDFDEAVTPNVKHRVYFEPCHEGDDGAGRLSTVYKDYQWYIERQYRDVGYSSKLKYVTDGRAEYIGAHFFVRNGLTDAKIPWTPAVGRYLLKLGVNATSSASPENSAARAASLALMFAARIECFACMFRSILLDILKKIDGKLSDVMVTVNPYSVESHIFAEGRHSLETILNRVDLDLAAIYPDMHVQVRMLTNSFELDEGTLNVTDLSKLHQLAQLIDCDMDDETAFGYLPVGLRPQ
jgi:hypothetical protein